MSWVQEDEDQCHQVYEGVVSQDARQLSPRLLQEAGGLQGKSLHGKIESGG